MGISILFALLIGLFTCWYFFTSLNKKVSFKELVKMMVLADMERLKK